MSDKPIAPLIELLREAEAPVRVLRYLAWPASAREDFFARGARVLPEVTYPRFDPAPTLDALARFRRRLGAADDRVGAWLARQADAIEHAAHMLAGIGTDAFLEHGRALFGLPCDPQPDETTTALGFARRLLQNIEGMGAVAADLRAPACHDASVLARAMRAAVDERFGADAPEVIVVDELSANALAGAQAIRIRANARFSDREIRQLIEHEAFVHVLTSLNGRRQPQLANLALPHPGTTRTQEGLAVFAEFITGQLTVNRLRRLADRVVAIQMALDGADFVEVYEFFRGRNDDAEQSFENARRVFRGGRVDGGIPFTKDSVYLDGLLRVHNFMRTAVSLGRADLLRLLFAGKLDIEDVPALAELRARGLCRDPVHLPPWIARPDFLLSQLAYSDFLNTVDLDRLREHYRELASAAPASSA